VDQFVDGRVDAVTVVYTKFVNGFTQTTDSFNLLPAGFETTEVSSDIATATFEPSVDEVLDGATVRLLEAQLYQALQTSKTSEQSMRRLAMKNATDNANDLVEDLTLEMNKVRQAAITQELSEISGGVEALK
jgi:F-type H+-transporting ATPase subunit gamma